MFLKTFNSFLARSPRYSDALILVVFAILSTINPYYLNDNINPFELGLYLSGIHGIQHGLVPYRDFFLLRGPLELYVPVWLMGFFGASIQVLCGYFFFGNVLCLILIVLIARELVRSRYMFYLMVPAIIAQIYPHDVFMMWGGMRYAFGLIAIFCLIRSLKNKNLWWMAAAGLISAWATLTSIEIGVCALAAVIVCLGAAFISRLIPSKGCLRYFFYFVAAGILGFAPWVIYALGQHAFIPYLDVTWTVVTRLHSILNLHLVSIYPRNFSEALAAMINPVNINFRQMTPSYLYISLVCYLIWRWRKGQWAAQELVLLSLGAYGLIIYISTFRYILGPEFKMALMPEKILYFFLIESAVLWAWNKRRDIIVAIVITCLFIFSWSSAISRYHHHFWASQYVSSLFSSKERKSLMLPDKKEKYAQLTIERAKGIWVHVDQYKDLSELDSFIRQRSSPEDVFVFFPQLGMYNFLFDRPFLGRFPIAIFSWFNDRWSDEYLNDLRSLKAKYIIIQKDLPLGWRKVHLWLSSTRTKYAQMLDVIHQFYQPIAQTEDEVIYERKP